MYTYIHTYTHTYIHTYIHTYLLVAASQVCSLRQPEHRADGHVFEALAAS